MCGLFGFVRSRHAPHAQHAAEVFVALGRLAEQRGRDAAGFAVVGPSPLPALMIKDTRPFGHFWRPLHAALLGAATVALGHTRHASQGAPDRLANAAPFKVGAGLLGMCNGDIDAEDLCRGLPPGLATPQGETDSERLLLALDRVRGDLQAVCEVLAMMRGLAALTWVDRDRPELVFLARGALVPLAIARDTGGTLYWASSPTWFRHLDERAGGRFGFRVDRVAEGTLLVVDTSKGPTVAAERRFLPTARAGDGQFHTIWKGLDPSEVAAFQAEARHVVTPGAGPAEVA